MVPGDLLGRVSFLLVSRTIILGLLRIQTDLLGHRIPAKIFGYLERS
jgi:hypothetical protein